MDDLDYFRDHHTGPSGSTIYHALRSSRRRLTILLIGEREYGLIPENQVCNKAQQKDESEPTEITVRTLAQNIVMIENNVSKDHATGDDYHNVYTSLIQTHLTRLDDISAIEYNSDRKLVRPGKNLGSMVAIVQTTSPLIQTFFCSSIVKHYSGSSVSLDNSITD